MVARNRRIPASTDRMVEVVARRAATGHLVNVQRNGRLGFIDAEACSVRKLWSRTGHSRFRRLPPPASRFPAVPIPDYMRTRCSGMESRGTAIMDDDGVIGGGWSAIRGALMGSVSVKIEPRPISLRAVR